MLHAHPDDECLVTGGSIAKLVADGHRVVLVVATDGRHGEVPGDLAPGETLVDRRRRELHASADVLGIQRVEWLGYADSGMTGWPQNSAPEAFINADVDAAAGRLAAIVREEMGASSRVAVCTYDWHGNYGHPDHVMVHKVGHRAAALAGVDEVYECTLNRDFFVRAIGLAKEAGIDLDWDPTAPADDGNPMGEPDGVITHHIDVRDYRHVKRAAIACHASQVTDSSFFLEMSDEMFATAFSTEWFIRVGAAAPAARTSLFDD